MKSKVMDRLDFENDEMGIFFVPEDDTEEELEYDDLLGFFEEED